MATQSGIRRRKKASSKSKDGNKDKETKPASSPNDTNNLDDPNSTPADPTLASVFFSHPLIRVGRFILIPYLLFHALNYIALQRPEWVGMATFGTMKLRPSVPTFDERQVLILGASIQDNKLMAAKLADTLKLEVAHETFDSLHNYCRDGSTSWYQIMRFLSYVPNTSDNRNKKNNTEVGRQKVEAFQELCIDRSSSLVSQFFDPRKYSPSDECSSREVWSQCWSRECFRTLRHLWDCTGNDNSNNLEDERFCMPSFRRILHQTRHPLSTIQLLNETYCSIEKIEHSFRKIVAGFFPYRDWEAMSSCLELVSWYTWDFESTLLNARRAGVVEGMFPLESTSPCEVAALAEFTDPAQALYTPHVDRLTKLCHSEESNKATSKHSFVPQNNKKNAEATAWTWENLMSAITEGTDKRSAQKASLIESLKSLSEDLGYGEGVDDELSEFI
ncbi:hypothetical protein IV203_026080 [Nitzschia inconspicua]|uniref:Uncharacterized protein n=1 Tax=Nitzschia inconspicua TaxID=303405 RepID=A0A9K3LHZ2_9STRA|nr:hypothetical protein IV203_026080 [Nitzschia inconspicua]